MGTQQIAQPEKGRLLAITYKNIEFNRRLKFPYDIPKGFKEIILE